MEAKTILNKMVAVPRSMLSCYHDTKDALMQQDTRIISRRCATKARLYYMVSCRERRFDLFGQTEQCVRRGRPSLLPRHTLRMSMAMLLPSSMVRSYVRIIIWRALHLYVPDAGYYQFALNM